MLFPEQWRCGFGLVLEPMRTDGLNTGSSAVDKDQVVGIVCELANIGSCAQLFDLSLVHS